MSKRTLLFCPVAVHRLNRTTLVLVHINAANMITLKIPFYLSTNAVPNSGGFSTPIPKVPLGQQQLLIKLCTPPMPSPFPQALRLGGNPAIWFSLAFYLSNNKIDKNGKTFVDNSLRSVFPYIHLTFCFILFAGNKLSRFHKFFTLFPLVKALASTWEHAQTLTCQPFSNYLRQLG